MTKEQILAEYKKQEDKLTLSQILDKIEFAKRRGKIENSDFLDMYQIALVKNFLRKIDYTSYDFYGGYEDAERNIIRVYEKNDISEQEKEANNKELLKIIRINLKEEDKGKFSHRNYLGGIVKLGIKREKVGDILVSDDGADIIVKTEIAESLKNDMYKLTRFQNAVIEIKEIEELRKVETKVENISIIVPSLRLDNIVSDLARTSRSKANEIISQERVFVNGQNATKPSKNVKLNDVITIRGKGRFIIKEFTGTTRSGRTVVLIEKYQ